MEIEHRVIEQLVRLKELPSVQNDVVPRSPNFFMYCSTPRPVLDVEISGGLHGRPLYRDNVPKPKGIHSYYNIAWDPRVKRGDPLQARKRREQLECEKIRKRLMEPRKRTRKSVSAEERRLRQSDPQVMIRAANMRYARLALSNLRPKEDAFLVELHDEVDEDEICYKGHRIAEARVLPSVPSRKRGMVDQCSQIWPGDFYQFDIEVVPVLERFVGALCWQARIEVLEEAELEALKLERKLFEERKRKEEEDLLNYKTRVERHLVEEERQEALARQLAKDEADGIIGDSLYAGVHVKYNVEEALRALGEEYQINEAVRKAIQGEFVEWMNGGVDAKLDYYYVSRKLLDEIIQHAVAEREAQIAAMMWRASYSEEPIRAISEESRVPPPTPGTSQYASDEEEGASSANYVPDELR